MYIFKQSLQHKRLDNREYHEGDTDALKDWKKQEIQNALNALLIEKVNVPNKTKDVVLEEEEEEYGEDSST